MRPGDFFLVNIPGPVGSLIRIGQWLNGDGFTTYEHAGILLDNNTVYEAEASGSRIAPVAEYDGSNIVFSSWDLTDQERARIVALARSRVDTPYGWLDYLVLAAHRFHLPIPGVRRYLASDKHGICSQEVDLIYTLADLHQGGPFQDGRPAGYVTPGMLRSVLFGPAKGF